MKKFLILLIFFCSFNVQASEFYNILLKTSPSMMDFGLLKIELRIDKQKDKIAKRLIKNIEDIMQLNFRESSYYDKKINDIEFRDSLYITVDEEKIDYSGTYNHQKSKIILELDIHLYVHGFKYQDFLINNYELIEPKNLCNEIREQIKFILKAWSPGKRGKVYFFNKFFANTGKEWKEDFIKDENTNLVVKLHWSYQKDEFLGLRTSVCLGDISSDSFYKEFDFYLLDNLEEHIKFADSY